LAVFFQSEFFFEYLCNFFKLLKSLEIIIANIHTGFLVCKPELRTGKIYQMPKEYIHEKLLFFDKAEEF